jgi:predicted NodU family carbamoyl transferase
MSQWIMGLGASVHNGAVCLLKDDEIVVAIQEERLVRTKRAALFGGEYSQAVEYCLDYAKIRPKDLSRFRKPWRNVFRDRDPDIRRTDGFSGKGDGTCALWQSGHPPG